MTSFVRKLPRWGFFIAGTALLLVPLFTWLPSAGAAAAGSLYSYTLSGSSATIPNQAETNTNVPLNLVGDWSQTPFGVYFDGNKTNKRSGAWADQGNSNTISVPGSQSVGVSVMFKYEAPTSGNCFSDSHNITQIGKFGSNLHQIKIQLTDCNKNLNNVYVQCRMAGSGSTTNDKPQMGTLPLVHGERYIATCVKAPDPASGKAIMELKTVRLDETNGHQVVSNAYEITRTGTIQSTDYLSVANKYPLPNYSSNTDQFNGEVAKVAFCKGVDIYAAKACLAAEVPEPADPPEPATNEVKYSYGNTPDSVVFNWRGEEQNIYYGLTTEYGQQAVAGNSAVTPWDISGPFREVMLSGLQPSTTYHYKIGENGQDYTFKTIPTGGDFKWVDIGDTKSSYCAPWMPGMHQLIAAQQPNFVTHGGDISILNECGIPAAHSYYTDQEVWSRSTAFQPVWGNHEYGPATPDAPFGTPRDSLANYKGRSFITNAQTVPNDTPTKTGHPGCGQEVNSPVNTCMGEDWGWFRVSGVLFISYPEPWPGALADWQTKADTMMAAAQADPTIDFIVTYGQQAAYTSSGEGWNTEVRNALNYLSQRYSPHAGNPNGKYVLGFGHDAHNEEVIGPVNGLMHVINAAGGQGFTNFTNIDPNSVFRMSHFAIVATNYSANAHRLDLRIICGTEFTAIKYNCDYGQVVYTQSFQRTDIPAEPGPSVLSTSLSDGAATVEVGQALTYTATAANAPGTETATSVQLGVTLPQNVSVTNANGGTVVGNTVTWDLGDLTAGQQVTRQVAVTVDSGLSGEDLNTAAQLTATACQNAGSDCDASDTTTISEPLPPPTVWQWVSNQSIEVDMTGWTGKYGGNANVSVTRDTTQAHSGTASIKVTGLSGASNLSSGFNDSPKWVTNATAGTTYTGSVWVKTSGVGHSVTLRLREWNGSTLVTDSKVTVPSPGTDWFEITNQITAAQNGTQLAFAVYGNDVDAGEFFYADDLSLTSPL